MTDIFTQPDDSGDLKSSDFSTSMIDRLGAQWADTLDPKNRYRACGSAARSPKASPAASSTPAVSTSIPASIRPSSSNRPSRSVRRIFGQFRTYHGSTRRTC